MEAAEVEGVDLLDLTQALADAIRANPTEYFWAHRRWKTLK